MGSPPNVNKILASPLRPEFSRTCPACQKRYALELKATREDAVVKKVSTYHCKACGHEVEYAHQHPPDAV